ncbi:cation efflux protein [Camillea tinctor]|nr:cation efflux protein [Camillea tinctor]
MAKFTLTPKQKLIATIGISFSFFVAEIAVAFHTKSLALLADAFHYMNDLIGFIVALVAIIISQRDESPQNYSFGWARAQLLGAFFNGVFLFALGISIFLQSIERFISIERVENPKLVLIMGSVGLALNIISATVLHEHHGHDHGGHSHGSHSHGHSHEHQHSHEGSHEHNHEHSHSHDHVNIEMAIPVTISANDDVPSTPLSDHAEHRHTITKLQSPGRDLGMMGVFIHGRFYADPGVSTGIAIMILLSSIPLVKNSGRILMQTAPRGVDLDDVKHDLEKIPGIESVHELHIWRLDQQKAIASAHVVVSNNEMSDFMDRARTVSECLHAYGIHSATLQPELSSSSVLATPAENSQANSLVNVVSGADSAAPSGSSIRRRRAEDVACQIVCGNLCENLTCCNASNMRL